jgi:hypothetical protein
MRNEHSGIGGAQSTARVPTASTVAEAERRAAVRTAAARYLLRTNNADLLPILGLSESGEPGCEWCSDPILRHSGSGTPRFCSRKCYAASRSNAAAAGRVDHG